MTGTMTAAPTENEAVASACGIDLSGVVVVIPALNEEASLPFVLRDLPAVGRVIIVDNGSTDRTADVAAAAGATVVREPLRGYGAACLKGLAAISESARAVRLPRIVV